MIIVVYYYIWHRDISLPHTFTYSWHLFIGTQTLLSLRIRVSPSRQFNTAYFAQVYQNTFWPIMATLTRHHTPHTTANVVTSAPQRSPSQDRVLGTSRPSWVGRRPITADGERECSRERVSCYIRNILVTWVSSSVFLNWRFYLVWQKVIII